MSQKLAISLTHAHDHPEKATMAFIMATAAQASGQSVLVFLNVEAVRLALAGEAERISLSGMPALGELMQRFIDQGGSVLVCSTCFQRRGLAAADLREGVSIAGASALAETIAGGAATLSW